MAIGEILALLAFSISGNVGSSCTEREDVISLLQMGKLVATRSESNKVMDQRVAEEAEGHEQVPQGAELVSEGAEPAPSDHITVVVHAMVQGENTDRQISIDARSTDNIYASVRQALDKEPSEIWHGDELVDRSTTFDTRRLLLVKASLGQCEQVNQADNVAVSGGDCNAAQASYSCIGIAGFFIADGEDFYDRSCNKQTHHCTLCMAIKNGLGPNTGGCYDVGSEHARSVGYTGSFLMLSKDSWALHCAEAEEKTKKSIVVAKKLLHHTSDKPDT